MPSRARFELACLPQVFTATLFVACCTPYNTPTNALQNLLLSAFFRELYEGDTR